MTLIELVLRARRRSAAQVQRQKSSWPPAAASPAASSCPRRRRAANERRMQNRKLRRRQPSLKSAKRKHWHEDIEARTFISHATKRSVFADICTLVHTTVPFWCRFRLGIKQNQ